MCFRAIACATCRNKQLEREQGTASDRAKLVVQMTRRAKRQVLSWHPRGSERTSLSREEQILGWSFAIDDQFIIWKRNPGILRSSQSSCDGRPCGPCLDNRCCHRWKNGGRLTYFTCPTPPIPIFFAQGLSVVRRCS
jgi:hypothetical protein